MYSLDNFKRLPKIGKLSPKAMEAFQVWDHLALAEGAIPKKYKELMAIAVALTTQCLYCIEGHRQAAVKAGASPEEFAEVILIAAAIRAGGAVMHGTHLMEG